jgi:hypothetical protein
MDKMLKLAQKMFGVLAASAMLLGVLSAPIGEVRADPSTVGIGLPWDYCLLHSSNCSFGKWCSESDKSCVWKYTVNTCVCW